MYKTFYDELLKKIEDIHAQETIIIAIDGMCASGKSTLCDYLVSKLDANVFHMDDFFLYPEMRTAQRLSEAGGNVYYERFSEQVLKKLCLKESFVYQKYNCKTGELESSPVILPKMINIIEGAYSMHPYFKNPYALTISLSINKEEQIARIRQRNGEMMAERFVSEWIPLENHYFEKAEVFTRSDIHIEQ